MFPHQYFLKKRHTVGLFFLYLLSFFGLSYAALETEWSVRLHVLHANNETKQLEATNCYAVHFNLLLVVYPSGQV